MPQGKYRLVNTPIGAICLRVTLKKLVPSFCNQLKLKYYV